MYKNIDNLHRSIACRLIQETLYNVCSVPWGGGGGGEVISTVGRYLEYRGGHHGYCGGYLEYPGGYSEPCGDSMSTVGDKSSLFEYTHGTEHLLQYSSYRHMYHDIPPWYSNYKR